MQLAASMEDLKRPAALETPYSLYTSTSPRAQAWHLFIYQKWKSLRLVIGCVALIVLSYAALLSLPTNVLLYTPFLSPPIRSFFGIPISDEQQPKLFNNYERKVKEVFERAAMPNRTIIITALNAAWAEEDTMIDMFLESFWHGDGTRKLLQHLVIVCVDKKAYQRCLVIHPHCISIKTEGVDFTGQQLLLSADFIQLMWRRIEFLGSVLAMNYSFIFTDTDVLWFRNPFPLLQSDTEADFQIACDSYNGRPRDVQNSPNTGFMYVRPNTRTVRLFGYWYEQRIRDPHLADQGMLNAIKFDKEFTSIGLKLRFIDTQFLGGFCGFKSTDMTKAFTMHATCCKGLDAKLTDLRMMLDGWKDWHTKYSTLSRAMAQNRENIGISPHNASASPVACLSSHTVEEVALDPHFKVPLACQQAWRRH